MIAKIRLFLALVALLTLAACQTNEQPTGRTITVLDETGQLVQVPEPTPEFVELLLAQVDAGEVSMEQAMITGLRIMAGELSPDGMFDEETVHFESGWGLTALAFETYQASSDEEAKAEIARLIEILAPPQERMDRYARPEESALRPAGLAAPALSGAGQSVPCTSIWAAGFPEDVVDPPVCLLYRSFSAEGYDYRVYYPEENRTDPVFLGYVDSAFEALQEAREVYDPLSNIRSINLVFTLLPSPLESAAEVPGISEASFGDRACPISVFPLALGSDVPAFKQTIAHEVFHCLHFFRVGISGYRSGAWYQEGMAEYFSNVVYPSVNDEHHYAEEFHIRSASEWLLDMEYENGIFFQYLGGRFGNNYLIDLIDALDTDDTLSAQADALAGYGDMQTIFHEFGQAYLMNQIPDTGGGLWPITILLPEENYFNIGEGRDLFLSTAPFTLQKYLLSFEEGRQYEIARETGGMAGKDSWRPPLPDLFLDIPATFTTSCGTNPGRLVLLTSAASGASATSQSELQMNITSGEAGYFDCCLVGTWEMGTSEVRRMFESIAAMPVEEVTGSFWLVITGEGNSTFTPVNYSATVTIDDRPATVGMEGASTGSLVTPEEGRIFASAGASSFIQTITTSSGSFSFPLEDAFIGPPVGEFGYVCSDRSLELLIPPGLAPFSSSTYMRVSDIPATPEPPEDFPGVPPSDGSDSGDLGDEAGMCTQVTTSAFSASGSVATWSLANSGESLVLDSLGLTFPAENGHLREMTFDGTTLWMGNNAGPNALLDFSSIAALDRTLASDVAALSFIFEESVIAGPGYALVAQFSGGCAFLDLQ